MRVSKRPKTPTARPPRSNRGSPGAADPLERLIRRAIDLADDPTDRRWLEGLLRGERANGSIGKAER